jgi:hypothetical protein
LLIGHRFASGAYSRLFHGIYKEQPVAAEVTILARLQHRNVIKVTT